MSETRNPVGQSQFLTFHLAGEEYAVEILRVKEIIALGALTKVPKTPPYIRGVINLRGSVVTVIDLAVRFGMSPSSLTKRTCIVMVEMKFVGELAIVGILADAVNEVIEVSDQDVLPTPHFGTPVSTDFLQGIARTPTKFVLILDIDKAVSSTPKMDSSPAGTDKLAAEQLKTAAEMPSTSS